MAQLRPVRRKRRVRIAAIVVASAATLAAAGAAAYAGRVGGLDPTFPRPSGWRAVTAWQIAPAPGADFIIKREIGASDATKDDTRVVTLTDENGDRITTNSSPWETFDAAQFGVPARARAVQLEFKAVITGIADSETTVYAFVKTYRSTLCQGPRGFKNYPVDFAWTGEAGGGGEKCWAIQGSIDGLNGVRELNTVDVPLTDGKFEFAWGYRKPPGPWPQGSALGLGVWLNGWGS